MRTGTRISAIGHGTLIVLAAVGLPWFGPREHPPIRVTDVSFISEAEFDAAQAAVPADAPRAADAPALPPAPRPAAEPTPPEPTPVEPPAEAAEPEPEAAVEPPAEVATPAPGKVTPRIITLDEPTAATPPQARPAPRVERTPTPAPPEDVRPAETPKPVTAPTPKPVVVAKEEPPAAPEEAAPQAEAAPEVPLALETSARPKARQVVKAPVEEPRDAEAEAVLAALQKKQTATKPTATKPTATRPTAARATPPTPATAPTEAAGAAAATSLPEGPPMSNSEKDGLKLAVQKCWNMPAGLRDANQLKVTLAAELGADGSVISASIRLIDPSPAPDGRFQQAYEAGRRALIRCSPYSDLPRDKFGQWRNIEVVFNPEGMVSW